jgi:uncharacterized protein with PQ loop repeat
MVSYHHLHVRKRASGALEPYPARTYWKWLLDRAVYAAGVIGPVMSLPQVATIYIGRDASGISPISWLAWAILDIPWILYGIAHREPPIVIMYSLWLVSNLLVFAGALIYG